MNLTSFRLAVLLPFLGGLLAHVGSVFSGQEGEHESQHDFDFLLKCLGHSHVEPAVEEVSSHFSWSILYPMRQNHV